MVANCPEAVIGALASASLGAVWSSCSPDFGISGIHDRLGQIEPKILITINAYYYNGKEHSCLGKNSGGFKADSLDPENGRGALHGFLHSV